MHCSVDLLILFIHIISHLCAFKVKLSVLARLNYLVKFNCIRINLISLFLLFIYITINVYSL